MPIPDDCEPLISRLQEIRSKQNHLWMNIVRIAMKYAPEESRHVFKEIESNDRVITEAIRDFYGDD